MLFQFNADTRRQFLCFLGRHQTNGKNNHIEFFFRKRSILIYIFNEQIVCLLQFLNRRRHRTDITDAVFFLGAVNKTVKVLTMGADIHIENGRLQSFGVFLADNRFFGGIHTAHGRTPTVVTGNIARTDALNESNLFRFFAVGDSLHMAEEGTRRGENSFKLNCRNNIFVNTVAVFSAQARVENFKTGRGNHGADFNYLFCWFHIVINRLGDTGFHALIAFRADAAIEATHRFRDGLRLAETNTNFLEISNAVFGFHVRIFFTRNFRNIRYVRFIRQIFCPVFLAAGFHIHALQIAVDGLSRFLTGINCFYNSLRAGGNVTAGKNTGNVCRVSDRVIIQIFPFINRYAAFLCDERQIRFLADSRNNGVALDDEF